MTPPSNEDTTEKLCPLEMKSCREQKTANGWASTLKRRIERTQRFVRQHGKPGRSLADELVAERREAGRRESDEGQNS